MTQPLDEFRAEYEQDYHVWWRTECGDHMNLFDEALERIDELTRQRDDARRIAIDSGIFQNTVGTDYPNDPGVPDHWRYPTSTPRLPPLRTTERATNTRCECNWCNGAGPA